MDSAILRNLADIHDENSLDIRMAANRDLPKLGSSCTTVVIARESDS